MKRRRHDDGYSPSFSRIVAEIYLCDHAHVSDVGDRETIEHNFTCKQRERIRHEGGETKTLTLSRRPRCQWYHGDYIPATLRLKCKATQHIRGGDLSTDAAQDRRGYEPPSPALCTRLFRRAPAFSSNRAEQAVLMAGKKTIFCNVVAPRILYLLEHIISAEEPKGCVLSYPVKLLGAYFCACWVPLQEFGYL